MEELDDQIAEHVRHAALAVAGSDVVDVITRNALRFAVGRKRQGTAADEDVARAAVRRVLAEAAAHPPSRALHVRIIDRSVEHRIETGIWTHDRLALVLRWTNLADFWIAIEDIRGVISIDAPAAEQTFTFHAPDRLDVGPRGELRFPVIAVRVSARPPRFTKPLAIGEATVETAVVGPWLGLSNKRHRFSAGRTQFPVSPALLVTDES